MHVPISLTPSLPPTTTTNAPASHPDPPSPAPLFSPTFFLGLGLGQSSLVFFAGLGAWGGFWFMVLLIKGRGGGGEEMERTPSGRVSICIVLYIPI